MKIWGQNQAEWCLDCGTENTGALITEKSVMSVYDDKLQHINGAVFYYFL